jgi:aryl-alcohol dehydrogenase-like predicted oxidoreductase
MLTRQLGSTDIEVSAVALGCWPISGMSSLDVTEADSLATLDAALDVGINFLDTAYCYGAAGESERLIARAIGGRRDEVVLATKGGLLWRDGVMVHDARPATLRRHLDESLRRLQTDRVELLYLHAPDDDTPLADSAGALKDLLDEGKTRAVGVSNLSLDQLETFAAVCPVAAFQPPYNMLMRQIEVDTLPWCRDRNISVMPYWPLMKGLLAGRLGRDFVMRQGDGRAKYPMFHGQEWTRNQDLIDDLRSVAAAADRSVAQLVIAWTLAQPGITSVLCGAKRAEQVTENAGGGDWVLDNQQTAAIAAALKRRGTPVTRAAV